MIRLIKAIRDRHEEADARTRAAEDEVRRSERRLEAIRTDVVQPLQKAASRNRFAELIRASLEGHGHQ